MPCNSDHLQATRIEEEMSRVMCIHDELDGNPVDPSWRMGYHPNAYGKADRQSLTIETRRLCYRMQNVSDMSKLSLEARIWWIEHQEHDRNRVKCEAEEARTEQERSDLLARLTPHERRLLGW